MKAKRIMALLLCAAMLLGCFPISASAADGDTVTVINPAGDVLLEDAEVQTDTDGKDYVDLGNGFTLYPGADGVLGTADDVVTGFGAYYQDDDTGVDKDPLNWRLLDIQGDMAILSTEMIIDGVQFGLVSSDSNAWADSNLRAWLNSAGGVNASGDTTGFYDAAFSDGEKEKIVLSSVSMDSGETFIAYNTTKTSDWWEYYSTYGESTQDYVWTLSGEEAFRYFGRSQIATEEELGHDPSNYTNGYFLVTDYAYTVGNVSRNTGGNGPSFVGFGDTWTRSPGRDMDESGNQYGVFWGTTGSLNSGRAVNRNYGALPVITVNLSENWTYNGDGTATDKATDDTVIVGPDGVAGTGDDNSIVSPAGKVLLENVELKFDGEGTPYVDLGNGFTLYAGADGVLGTTDDIVAGFGAYPQSDVTGATDEPLNWRLLDIDAAGRAILSTELIVDGIRFNLNSNDGNDWAYSNLRSWLNSTGGVNNLGSDTGFYDAAFTAEEKASILLTDVGMISGEQYIAYNTTKSSDWWEYYTTFGYSTQDYVWALSAEEAFAYFGTSKIATELELGHDPANYTNGYFRPSAYALAGGAKVNSGGNGNSFIGFGDTWTRSAGRDVDDSGNYYGVFWGSTGSLNSGRTVSTVYGAMPVITVQLDTDVVRSGWLYHGDGTATDVETGALTIVGLDGVAGTDDDNRIVSPAGNVLLEGVQAQLDGDGVPYVDLGNGFSLYGGADGVLGTGYDEVVNFGAYPQSDVTGDADEPLNWRLLDIVDGEAVLMTTQMVDAVMFNLDATDGNDWAGSNLRAWLNSAGGESYGGDETGFYDRAFTAEEKAKINLTQVKMDYSDWDVWTHDGDANNYQNTTGTFPGYDRTIGTYELYTTTGASTEDYVYVISGEEAFLYYGTDTILNPDGWDIINFTTGHFSPTAYAAGQGVSVNTSASQWMYNGYADSWTRSPGRASATNSGGEEEYYGTFWGSYGNMNTGRVVSTTQNACYGTLPMIRVSLSTVRDDWDYHDDGTATNVETGETVIVGLDGLAGTGDDNRIVNPAGTVLLENVQVQFDTGGDPYVALGNGFSLYGGADGKIGTTDDVVTDFGQYYQSDETGGTMEPLSWRLLDIEDGQAILSTEMIIDGVQFNPESTDTNAWADSNLRAWLNSAGGVNAAGDSTGFYDAAFSEAEKEAILLTHVSMDSTTPFIAYNTTKSSDWWEYYTTHGESTQDYVWALSGEEAFLYFGPSQIATEEELGHAPENYTNGYFLVTDYAHSVGNVNRNTGGNGASFVGFGDTWTRSPGRDIDENGNQYGVFWGSTGSLNSGRAVNRNYGAMPVVTVSLVPDEIPPETAEIVVRGVDENGNVLYSDTVVREVGTQYTATARTLSGYDLDGASTQTITVAAGQNLITFSYTTKDTDTDPEPTPSSDLPPEIPDLNCSATEGGKVTIGEVDEDGNVEIIVEPDDGYELVTLLINGVAVSLRDLADGVYTIENAQSGTTVRAIFILEGEDFAAKFTDVPKTTNGEPTWYYDAVNLLTGLGIIDGKTETEFEPAENIRRAEFTKLLFGLAETLGVEAEEVDRVPFTDADYDDHWATGYIGWAYENEIVNGYNEVEFGPDDYIIRQDMALMLQRFFETYLGYDLPGDTAIAFADGSDIETYAAQAVDYVVRTGLMQGDEDTNFNPKANALRQEVAQVLYNYLIA